MKNHTVKKQGTVRTFLATLGTIIFLTTITYGISTYTDNGGIDKVIAFKKQQELEEYRKQDKEIKRIKDMLVKLPNGGLK